jgi:ankyrin repeat protein
LSRAQVIVCLIHHGASVNFETHSHDTALIVAAQTANLDAIKSLVRLGAAVNYETKDGRTALTTAAMVGKVDAIEELIRQVRPPSPLLRPHPRRNVAESTFVRARTNRLGVSYELDNHEALVASTERQQSPLRSEGLDPKQHSRGV